MTPREPRALVDSLRGRATITRTWEPVLRGILAVVTVILVGTTGYLVMGRTFIEALYQTIITISTVGFREVGEFGTAERVFTIGLILVGVGATLYTFTVLLETIIEGRLADLFGRRRMDRRIAEMRGHVIVCGWGRVGRAIASALAKAGRDLVVIDQDGRRLEASPHAYVQGDATDDSVLRAAGVERAGVLIAALNTDADNLYTTMTGRALAPDVFIVARARQESAELRLHQGGANRVVNPQRIGGDRMAAFALQPHVAEFLDVVMHDVDLEFRLSEVRVEPGSSLAGQTLRSAQIRDRTGAMVLALREPGGQFHTNPSPDTTVLPGHVLIAIGTPEQLGALAGDAGPAESTVDGNRASS